nr:ribonuclease H-like domain-containing protein [Tanacetum cinerariifolium]
QVTLHDKRIVMQVTFHYEAIVMQVTLPDKRIVMQVTLHYEQQQVFEIYFQDQVQGQRFRIRLLKIQVAQKKVKIDFENADSSSRVELIPSKIKYANKVVLNFHKEFSVFSSFKEKEMMDYVRIKYSNKRKKSSSNIPNENSFQNTQTHVSDSATTPLVQHEPTTPLPTASPTQQANHSPQSTNPPTTAPTTSFQNNTPTVHAQPYSSPPSHNPEPIQTHTMVTRSKSGVVKPIECLSLHTSSISPILKSPFLALNDPNCCTAMNDEYNALAKNGTWILVSRPSDVNLVCPRWLFKHKFHVDGTLSHYKTRLVANSSSRQLGVDFDKTFSPVVKPATICTVLSLFVSRKWPIHQPDVKNSFLNGDLSETGYMYQPPGFVDS